MKRIVLTAVVITLGLTGPVAAQPFSKSMAECAGLYAFGRDYVDRDDLAHLLEFGQAKWMNAAIVRAQSEGVADPNDYVETAMTAKYDEWSDRGIRAVFTEEFHDWLDYCRAFGADQGIDLDPS